MAVTCDPEHKFELAIQLADLRAAYELAKESQSEAKWKQLAELAVRRCEFGLAQECLHQAQDFGGLLLLASSAGNRLGTVSYLVLFLLPSEIPFTNIYFYPFCILLSSVYILFGCLFPKH